MTPALRPLDELDARRADAIAGFLARYRRCPSTHTTLVSALGTITEVLGQDRRAIATIEWELFADAQLYDRVTARLADRVGPASQAKLRWALHGLLRHLARIGIADDQALRQTLSGLPNCSSRPSAGVAVTDDDLAAMLRSCLRDPNTAKGSRDAAILATLSGTGGRRAEIARANREDLDLTDGKLVLATKGGGLRTAPLPAGTVDYLTDWLDHHPVRRGALFVPVAKNGALQAGAALNDRSVHRVVALRRDQAGAHPDISPHSFRRWYVSSLLDTGADLLTTMRAVGHANPGTTQRYDRRPDTRTRAAVSQLHIPTPEDIAEEP